MGTAEQFDIGDDELGGDGWAAKQGDGAGAQGGTDPTRRIGQESKSAEWKPEGPGRWARARPGVQSTDAAAATAGHEAVAVGLAPTGTTSQDAGARNKRGAGAPPAEAAQQQQRPQQQQGVNSVGNVGAAPPTPPCAGDADGDDADASESTRAGKHRRQRTEAELREEADRKRAAELLQQEQLAVAAQRASHEAGAGGFGSHTALSMAAQRFVTEVQKATEQAHKAGVEPRTRDGRELLELTPLELNEWVTEYLGDEANWAA